MGSAQNFQAVPIRSAPEGAPTVLFAAAVGGTARASAGRRSASTTTRRTASTPWASVWPAVSRHSKQ